MERSIEKCQQECRFREWNGWALLVKPLWIYWNRCLKIAEINLQRNVHSWWFFFGIRNVFRDLSGIRSFSFSLTFRNSWYFCLPERIEGEQLVNTLSTTMIRYVWATVKSEIYETVSCWCTSDDDVETTTSKTQSFDQHYCSGFLIIRISSDTLEKYFLVAFNISKISEKIYLGLYFDIFVSLVAL